MATLLFKLYNVPEDEADDVRSLLGEHGYNFYETYGGFFGLGVAGIWLYDSSQYPAARALINQYQQERSAQHRNDYAEQKALGTAPTIKQKIQERPIHFFVVIALIVAVAIISFLPIWAFLGR